MENIVSANKKNNDVCRIEFSEDRVRKNVSLVGNSYNLDFRRKLEKNSRYGERFVRHIIGGVRLLSENSAELHSIDGETLSYSSRIVRGHDFRSFFDEDVEYNKIPNRDKIIGAIDRFLDTLGRPHIIGDWTIHNIMWDEDYNKLINIDLEGFLTYRKPVLFNNSEFISKSLNLVKDRLRYADVLTLSRDAIDTNKSAYNGRPYINGYHPIYSNGQLVYPAQRDTTKRIGHINFDLTGLTVLDLGCNQGGMIREMAAKIKWGVGVDYDRKLINIANRAKRIAGHNNLDYYNIDLDKDDPHIVEALLPGKVDVCLFLSVCMWIKHWRRWMAWIGECAKILILETNGTESQQREQLEEAQKYFSAIHLLSDESDDDQNNKNRRLYRLDHQKPPDKKIPKIIHQIWIGDPAKRPIKCMETFKKIEGWEYKLWTEKEIDEFGLVNRRLYDFYYQQKHYPDATDVLRVEILNRYGGFYVDADTLCVAPFDELFEQHTFWAPYRDIKQERLVNCYIASIPNHPILQNYIVELGKLKQFYPAYIAVGSVLLTRMMKEHGDQHTKRDKSITWLHMCLDGKPNPEPGKNYFHHLWGSGRTGLRYGKGIE